MTETLSSVEDEQILNRVPSELIIPANHLRMTDKLIGQGMAAQILLMLRRDKFGQRLNGIFSTGEFGKVYEAQLINWRWYQKNTPVAVKRLKGIILGCGNATIICLP